MAVLPLLSVSAMEMLWVPGNAATYQLPAVRTEPSFFCKVTELTASAAGAPNTGASAEQSTVNAPAIALSELMVIDLSAVKSAGTATRISPQRFLKENPVVALLAAVTLTPSAMLLLSTSCVSGRVVVMVAALMLFASAYGYTAYQKPPSATSVALPENVAVAPAVSVINSRLAAVPSNTEILSPAHHSTTAPVSFSTS